jgi:hypothetical protein
VGLLTSSGLGDLLREGEEEGLLLLTCSGTLSEAPSEVILSAGPLEDAPSTLVLSLSGEWSVRPLSSVPVSFTEGAGAEDEVPAGGEFSVVAEEVDLAEDEAEEEEEEEEVGGRAALAAESLSSRAAEAVCGGFEMCEADSW